MYLRDEVSLEETLRVPKIPQTVLFNNRPARMRESEARIGLWKVTAELEDWADDIVESLVREREESELDTLPREVARTLLRRRPEWVGDDAVIIGEILETLRGRPPAAIFLVSNDKRLARAIAQATKSIVYCANVADVILMSPHV